MELLQIVMDYYKLRQVLQIATVPLGQNIQLGPPSRGGLAYERGGDTRRLA